MKKMTKEFKRKVISLGELSINQCPDFYNNMEENDSNYNLTRPRETFNFNTSINSNTKLNFSFRIGLNILLSF